MQRPTLQKVDTCNDTSSKHKEGKLACSFDPFFGDDPSNHRCLVLPLSNVAKALSGTTAMHFNATVGASLNDFVRFQFSCSKKETKLTTRFLCSYRPEMTYLLGLEIIPKK